jgi:hypothetical protein
MAAQLCTGKVLQLWVYASVKMSIFGFRQSHRKLTLLVSQKNEAEER